MNKIILQIFLIMAFIPLAILIGIGILVLAPIFCCFFAMNSYKLNNHKEMYFWIVVGLFMFFISLLALGVV